MIDTTSHQLTTKELTATLDYLGVHFLAGETENDFPVIIDSPSSLLFGLTSSDEARVRLALIPLFLRHPFHADYVPEAFTGLSNPQCDTL